MEKDPRTEEAIKRIEAATNAAHKRIVEAILGSVEGQPAVAHMGVLCALGMCTEIQKGYMIHRMGMTEAELAPLLRAAKDAGQGGAARAAMTIALEDAKTGKDIN